MSVLRGLEADLEARLLPSLAGPRTADRLDGARRRAAVVHRGRDAVYLDVDGWCLGVVRDPAVHVPCALVLDADADVDLAAVRSAEAGKGELVLNGTVVVRPARYRDPRVDRVAHPPHPDAVEALLAHAAPARDELGDNPAPLENIGRGSGLTPLGDDVLAGWLATSYALGAAATLVDVRDRTTLLSATLIDCAARGEVLPEFRAVVASLPDPVATDAAAGRLAQVGHTSGAGLLLGAWLRLSA